MYNFAMRNFISRFAMLAFVITTSFTPSLAHALNHDTGKGVEGHTIKAAKTDDHGHGEAKADSQKIAQSDQKHSCKCCDKGMCKCIGGNCHSLSKYFGNGNNFLAALSSSISAFAFDTQFVDSALPHRLKRPPKT